MPKSDYKIKLGDVLFPVGGYIKYTERHKNAINLGHPDAGIKSAGLLVYHTVLTSAIVITGIYAGMSLLEKITNS